MIKELIDCSNTKIIINSNDAKTIRHFSDPNNYADYVLNFFNTDRSYDKYLIGRKDLVILDLGANIGFFSLYAYPCAKLIIAVEPSTNFIEILRDLTRDYTNIIPAHYAISNINGKSKYYVSKNNTTGNSLINKYSNIFTNVEVITIPTLLDKYEISKVDFVKCDIEGAEMIAFNDDLFIQLQNKIKQWFVETHTTDTSLDRNKINISVKKNTTVLIALFEKYDYRVEQLREDAFFAELI